MASAAEPVAAPGSRPAVPPPAEPPPVEPPPVEFVPDGPAEPPAYATAGPPPEAEEDAPSALPQSFRAMAELFHARGEPVVSAPLAGAAHCVRSAERRVGKRGSVLVESGGHRINKKNK